MQSAGLGYLGVSISAHDIMRALPPMARSDRGSLHWQALAATETVARQQKQEAAAAAAVSEERLRQSTAERAAACGQHSALAAAHRRVTNPHVPTHAAICCLAGTACSNSAPDSPTRAAAQDRRCTTRGL